MTGHVLSPTELDSKSGKTVFEVLKEKHPMPGTVDPITFIGCNTLPPLIDVDVTPSHVEKVAHCIRGGAGPGGTDSLQWQHFLLRYGTHSARLRDGVAALTRRLANKLVDWEDISALMANRLIAIDKCPGVRPIGIGECLRRVICKTMALVTGRDVEVVCGVEQLATGLKSGIEGAVHGMTALYDEFCDGGWGFLLIDAKNAFNMINREAALWNAYVLWPRCIRFLFNTYRDYAKSLGVVMNSCIAERELRKATQCQCGCIPLQTCH